jgi:hypothetical protein
MICASQMTIHENSTFRMGKRPLEWIVKEVRKQGSGNGKSEQIKRQIKDVFLGA